MVHSKGTTESHNLTSAQQLVTILSGVVTSPFPTVTKLACSAGGFWWGEWIYISIGCSGRHLDIVESWGKVKNLPSVGERKKNWGRPPTPPTIWHSRPNSPSLQWIQNSGKPLDRPPKPPALQAITKSMGWVAPRMLYVLRMFPITLSAWILTFAIHLVCSTSMPPNCLFPLVNSWFLNIKPLPAKMTSPGVRWSSIPLFSVRCLLLTLLPHPSEIKHTVP